MKFDQLIQYKTLDRIHSLSNSDLVDRVALSEEVKSQMKNVCALISVPLFEDLEAMCGLLGLSKRQFIEASLIDALAKAENIVQELGLYDEMQERSAAQPQSPVAPESLPSLIARVGVKIPKGAK